MTDQKDLTERNWFASFLQSREGFPRSPRCNYCEAPMYHGEGVVPVWKCPECHREVPRV